MINIIKTTKLTANITRKNETGADTTVVHLECSFSNNDTSSAYENNMQTMIHDRELYLKHKTEIRQEISEFMEAAYEVQDEIGTSQEVTQ